MNIAREIAIFQNNSNDPPLSQWTIRLVGDWLRWPKISYHVYTRPVIYRLDIRASYN